LIGGKRTAEREARFRRVQPDQPNVHHDALELPSGETVLLTRLSVAHTGRRLEQLGATSCKARWRAARYREIESGVEGGSIAMRAFCDSRSMRLGLG
jgi:hypothetical protein